jgi:ABC-2 type transport system ATP-binding protein
LILDEPTSGMDPVGSRQIKDLIATLARRGKTVLLCSHLLGDVEDLCDRVAIMYGGRVRAEGTCAELLTQEHATILETSDMPDGVVAEVRDVLARHDLALKRVAHPRRSLESLFLEIVERAKAEGVRTAGASAGGPVADFLAEPQPPTAAAETGAVDAGLLDSLTRR